MALLEIHTRFAHNLGMSRLADNGSFGLEYYLIGQNDIKVQQLLTDGVKFCDKLMTELNNSK